MSDREGLPHVIDLKVRVRCQSGENPKFLPYMIAPRSSISKTPLSLANSVGIVDRGYTGNLKVAVRNHSEEVFVIAPGTSLFQLVLPNLAPARVAVAGPGAPAFAEGVSVRGEGGFGSTGRGGVMDRVDAGTRDAMGSRSTGTGDAMGSRSTGTSDAMSFGSTGAGGTMTSFGSMGAGAGAGGGGAATAAVSGAVEAAGSEKK